MSLLLEIPAILFLLDNQSRRRSRPTNSLENKKRNFRLNIMCFFCTLNRSADNADDSSRFSRYLRRIYLALAYFSYYFASRREFLSTSSAPQFSSKFYTTRERGASFFFLLFILSPDVDRFQFAKQGSTDYRRQIKMPIASLSRTNVFRHCAYDPSTEFNLGAYSFSALLTFPG